MQAIYGEKIPFTFQMINPDGTIPETANIELYIYDADFNPVVGPITLPFEGTLFCYKYTLDPFFEWITQAQYVGNYHIKWVINNWDEFEGYVNVYNEELEIINPDYTDRLTEILTNVRSVSGAIIPEIDDLDTQVRLVSGSVWNVPTSAYGVAGSYGEMVEDIYRYTSSISSSSSSSVSISSSSESGV